MLRLGTLGFGGPVALAGYMHRDLVDERRWIGEADFKEGLALAQLMPGPLAAQLAMYLGYVHYRVLGATLVGVAFVLPSFFMVVALGWAYVRYGGLSWMQAVFYGVGAAVIGIIAMSAYKLTRKSIGADKLLWAIYLVVVAITVLTENEMAWVFIAGGLLVWFWRAPPRWLKHGSNALIAGQVAAGASIASTVDWPLLAQIGVFFAKAGAFVFGSGLAIVPFLYGGVVTENHWLNERQFVDAVAVAMITPGPVVITVGFIGYLVAGFAGAVAAALATFLPCYLFTIVPAPYFKKYGKLPGLVAFVDGVTAAAIGAITGAVIVIARRSIVDVPTALLAIFTLVLLWRFKKLQEPIIVAGAAVIGLLIYAPPAHASDTLQPSYTVMLPSVKGRIDHLDYDPATGRVFVAALGNDSVEVIDARGKLERSLKGFGEPQGITYASESKRIVVANGGAGRVDLLDAASLKVVAQVKGLDDADNVRYDAATSTALVGYGAGLAFIDAAKGELLARVALPGHPESFQLERNGPRVFVNVPTARKIVVIDRVKRQVVGGWDVADAGGNFPMALDERGRRLFVGARSPAVMLVYDIDSGKVVSRTPIGGDTDDIFYDEQRKRVYVICGAGRVEVIRQDSPDRYAGESSVETATRARTGLFMPAERKLLVAAPAGWNTPARILAYSVR